MTANTPRGTSARISALSAAVLAGALLVQGCADKGVVPTASGSPVYGIDLAGGAKKCVAPAEIAFGPNKEAAVPMTVGNDGGWCAITVALPGPKPYSTFGVSPRPAHGNVFVHRVGDRTRIDYTPDRAFAGTDSFTVRLIPDDQLVRVTVTVGPA